MGEKESGREQGTVKKLFLLDAMALVYRAYFAFTNNPRINSKGQNTSAMFGFTNTLLEVLQKQKPTHMAIVFDTAAPTTRHAEHAEYKANRQEVPEDIAAALPYVSQLADAMNITVLASDGYEADDIIGTLAKQAEKQGFDTYMMTPDKDFGQLVDEHTFIYKPARAGITVAEVMGVKEVCDRWQIENVDQVRDILGLMGDSVDNIPGIAGIGEKTAMSLVKQFGTIENLLQNTDQLKGKLKERVENNRDIAIQSKRLATIITDVPVEVDLENLKLREANKDALAELFTELEFRNFAERMNVALGAAPQKVVAGGNGASKQGVLFGEPDAAAAMASRATGRAIPASVLAIEIEPDERPQHDAAGQFKTMKDVAHQYHIVDTDEKRAQLIKNLAAQKLISFDTENTDADVLSAELIGLSFSYKEHEAYYVPIPFSTVENVFEKAKAIIQEFKPIFEDEQIAKIGLNIKFDMSMLHHYGVHVCGNLFDTMVSHFLIQPEMRHSMDVIAETFLNYSPSGIESLIGKKGRNQGNICDVPVEKVAEYSAEDADITLQLHQRLGEEMQRLGVKKLFDEVEMPLVPVLADMEAEGIRVDVNALKDLSAALESDIRQCEDEIQQMAGEKFNVGSPKQVGEVLFERMKISDNPPKTKTGQFSTGEEVLSKMESKHPIVRRILDYRELVKLKNTYVDVLPEMINARTQRLHTCYNQVVAVTGRLSSDNPNLQNIPIRTERGREIRKAFIARDDNHVLLSADYSQIELRIIAELSGDEGMLEAFRNGEDIHTATASKVFSVPLNEVTKEMRSRCKMVNFGIIYGISAFGLAERLNIARAEAKTIIENYFRQYTAVRQYMQDNIDKAREKGYVETILGRRRYLRDIRSGNATVRGFAERIAINAPIQGSAADMIKIAMINIHKDFQQQKLKSKMLLQVHDELVFDVLKREEEAVKKIVENRMKTALPLSVPVDIGIGFGKNWLEAH